jgi:TonB family protein
MDTTAVLADREGRVVDGRFSLLRWLGGSAEGSVYLTDTGDPGRGKAAIKLVPADSPGAEARLAGWAAAARIAHPHLLRVLHTGRGKIEGGPRAAPADGEVVYVVTEFADEVLAEILPGRPLTPDETRDMLEPVLDALGCLHDHGLVHGRLKPTNILVVADNLKLSADCSSLESGKAAAVAPDLSTISPYEAPELRRGPISLAADVWSLGMIIAAALTQRTPAWERESGFEPVVRPALPPPYEGIVRDCLRIDSASRITLPEIKDRLEGNEPDHAAQAALHPDFDPDFNPSTARSSRWIGAAVGVAVFLGIAITALVLHSRQSSPTAPVTASQSASVADQQPSPDAAAPAPNIPPEAAHKPSASLPAHGIQPSAPRSAAPPQAPARQPAEISQGGNGAILKRVLPDVLPSARASIHGTVQIHVRVQVSASGAVTNAESESPAASRYFNRIAVQAAQTWQFAPAQGGSVWLLNFQFRADGTDVTTDRQAP